MVLAFAGDSTMTRRWPGGTSLQGQGLINRDAAAGVSAARVHDLVKRVVPAGVPARRSGGCQEALRDKLADHGQHLLGDLPAGSGRCWPRARASRPRAAGVPSQRGEQRGAVRVDAAAPPQARSPAAAAGVSATQPSAVRRATWCSRTSSRSRSRAPSRSPSSRPRRAKCAVTSSPQVAAVGWSTSIEVHRRRAGRRCDGAGRRSRRRRPRRRPARRPRVEVLRVERRLVGVAQPRRDVVLGRGELALHDPAVAAGPVEPRPDPLVAVLALQVQPVDEQNSVPAGGQHGGDLLDQPAAHPSPS